MTDLFGQPAKPEMRYAEGTRSDRPTVRPWTAQEDLALWAAWVSCNSILAEQRVADLFCQILDRPAVLPGTPTTAQLAQERLSLIRRRTIHSPESILGGGRTPVTALCDALVEGRRVGRPLTMVEWAVFTRHQQLVKAKKPRIPIYAVLRLLERTETDPELKASSPDLDSSKGDPANPLNAMLLGASALAFTRAAADDLPALKHAWSEYHRALRCVS